jgi:hypothetical protein
MSVHHQNWGLETDARYHNQILVEVEPPDCFPGSELDGDEVTEVVSDMYFFRLEWISMVKLGDNVLERFPSK